MPPSQLKRLKESLREEGLVGPQQSKKQKQKAKGNGSNHDWKVQRQNAIRGRREQCNPFEVQHMSRGREKFEVIDSRTEQGKGAKTIKGRPGVTKGLGEENRRKTLLVEMQRRKKVGGILDKRFGENDPTMTPEERNLERFTKEKQRGFKTGSMFDLEDEIEEEHQLTHFGQSLTLNGDAVDDFDDTELALPDEDDTDKAGLRKRRRPSDLDGEDKMRDVEADGPARKKSKAEVMKEVMAKSKLYKYERQQAKDEDEEAREEIDRELPQLFALLNGTKLPEPAKEESKESDTSIMDAGRAALISGSKPKADRDYDEQLRQMIFDKRSQPTERTKTGDEKANAELRRLKELEEERLRRMLGEDESDDEHLGLPNIQDEAPDAEYNDAEAFGIWTIIPRIAKKLNLDVEEEDNFVIDDGLVDSASEFELSDNEDPASQQDEDEEDQEFLRDLLPAKSIDLNATHRSEPVDTLASKDSTARSLPFTYPCPQTHKEFLEILKDIPLDGLPTVIQRIRALYHPKLNTVNNAKLGKFAAILVDHISYLANNPKSGTASATVIETLIRHLHSLAKIYAEEVGTRFRYHLQNLSNMRSTTPTKGDLMLLTAIASIFSTSDHFHSIATPANLCMTRYLAQKLPDSINDLVTGTYISTLCLHYQRLSKRYVPEVLNYTLTALYALSPIRQPPSSASFFFRECPQSFRIETGQEDFSQCASSISLFPSDQKQKSAPGLKIKLVKLLLTLLEAMVDMWKDKLSLLEILDPAIATIHLFISKSVGKKMPGSIKGQAHKLAVKFGRLLAQAKTARQPLELHHHRPLAIKTSIPKFEETYNPDKHYDPDRERAESSKLKAEHKKERKGALRELRKDANFIARETLKEKKERDRKYEEKYKRLVAEIQGDEGREANEYEREKRLRKKKR